MLADDNNAQQTDEQMDGWMDEQRAVFASVPVTSWGLIEPWNVWNGYNKLWGFAFDVLELGSRWGARHTDTDRQSVNKKTK